MMFNSAQELQAALDAAHQASAVPAMPPQASPQVQPQPDPTQQSYQSPQPFDLSSLFNNPALTQASQTYADTANAAVNSQATDVSLPTMLRNALASKLGNNNPLVGNRETALTNYLNSIPKSQESVLPQNNNGVIFNPMQQADLIQKGQSAPLAQLATSNWLLGNETGGLQNIIDTVAQAHQAETQGLVGKANVAQNVYKNLIDQVSTAANLALKQQQLQAEYGTGTLPPAIVALLTGNVAGAGGTGGTGGTGGQQTGQAPSTNPTAAERKLFQLQLMSTLNPRQQQLIKDAWNLKHPGVPLETTTPTGADITQITSTNLALQKINSALDILNKSKSPGVGGFEGVMNQLRLEHPLVNGMLSSLPFGLGQPNQDTKKLFDAFLNLQTLGERGQVGGRLSGYLLTKLGPAYAQLSKDPDTLIRELKDMKDAAMSDLQTQADAHGYDSISGLPGLQSTNLQSSTDNQNTTNKKGPWK